MANDERNITTYKGRFLGCQVKQKKDSDDKYGVISLAYFGVREDDKKPWYSVQDLYVSVEKMEEICKDIPFDSAVELEFYTGTTPGGKQRLSKIIPID